MYNGVMEINHPRIARNVVQMVNILSGGNGVIHTFHARSGFFKAEDSRVVMLREIELGTRVVDEMWVQSNRIWRGISPLISR